MKAIPVQLPQFQYSCHNVVVLASMVCKEIFNKQVQAGSSSDNKRKSRIIPLARYLIIIVTSPELPNPC